jgi:malate synthase
VPLYNLMEDAATAEISRTQLWQWRKHGAKLKDGRAVDDTLLDAIFEEEMKKIREAVGDAKFNAGAYVQAADLLKDLVSAEALADFLTVPAYDLVVASGA